MPDGICQEETAKRLWATGHMLREKAANPEMLIRYGAEEVYDEETGMKLPEKSWSMEASSPMWER